MCKNDLLKWVYELPDDIQIYRTEINNYDCVDIKIFTKPKKTRIFRRIF